MVIPFHYENYFTSSFLVFLRPLVESVHFFPSLPEDGSDSGRYDKVKVFELGCLESIPAKEEIDQRAGTMWGNDGGGSLAALLKSFFFYPFDQFI